MPVAQAAMDGSYVLDLKSTKRELLGACGQFTNQSTTCFEEEKRIRTSIGTGIRVDIAVPLYAQNEINWKNAAAC